MMTIFDAIILGLIEGITEYLPISSTGHLIIANAFLMPDSAEGIKSAVDAYTVIIQGGAILAVLGLYRVDVRAMVLGLFGKHAEGLRLFINILIAFLPAVVFGLLLEGWISEHLFFPVPVVAALALGGVWMIRLGFIRRRRLASGEIDAVSGGKTIHEITPLEALKIGLFQCVAMWPGTSRSMMTIAGGTMLGLHPKEAAKFSFLLGLPTLGGACVYKIAKNVLEAEESGGQNFYEVLGGVNILVGIVVTTIAAGFAVKWLVAFLNKHGLTVFGYYRLMLSAVIAVLVLTNVISF